MAAQRVVIVGAGIAGLVAAVATAARGFPVTVLERAPLPGGKLREVTIGTQRLDAGPTVFTLRSVFDELFALAGASLDDHVTLRPAGILARHTWTGRESLDLYADVNRSAEDIGQLAGAAEAQRFLEFTARSRRIYQTLEHSFIRAAVPSPLHLAQSAGLKGLGNLLRISPFATMWNALGEHFHDARLQQLFGRYATYCGSSPFLSPATLMLVAHVEQEGVWLVEGGMYGLITALETLALKLGVRLRYNAEVTEVLINRGRSAGVRLGDGEQLPAEAVVLNADIAAVSTGRFGTAIAGAAPRVAPEDRSLSAYTWNLIARPEGFPLARHTVFFSPDYAAEFTDLFERRRAPQAPTVYVCAQDRDDRTTAPASGGERLLCLTNAPPTGDHPGDPLETQRCWSRLYATLSRCGLNPGGSPEQTVTTTPQDFNRMFPGSGGALYGQASHGWQASFRRTGPRSRIPGLYFAGGSIHPGPGVPMAALSGQQAAQLLAQDFASTSPYRMTAMRGGISMR